VIINQDEGVWYAKQNITRNVVCIGFGSTPTVAAKCCAELIVNRRAQRATDKTKS